MNERMLNLIQKESNKENGMSLKERIARRSELNKTRTSEQTAANNHEVSRLQAVNLNSITDQVTRRNAETVIYQG